MTVILELMTFFAMCLTNIFSILDNSYLGNISILSIICSMAYITITLQGIFNLLNVKQNDSEAD
jgi:hypothetical protein